MTSLNYFYIYLINNEHFTADNIMKQAFRKHLSGTSYIHVAALPIDAVTYFTVSELLAFYKSVHIAAYTSSLTLS